MQSRMKRKRKTKYTSKMLLTKYDEKPTIKLQKQLSQTSYTIDKHTKPNQPSDAKYND